MKVIKVPFNANALEKKNGIENAPDKIVSFLNNFYLKENGLLPFFEIDSIKVDNANIEYSNQQIELFVSNLQEKAVLLGGDHSITYPSFRAFSKKFKNPGLIIFDAHVDCENDFRPPTHEDFVRVLIEEGTLKKENLIFIGIRNMHTNELDFIKKNKLKIYDMKEISNDGKNEIIEAIMSVAKNFDGLYISLDIDALDPAFAPGTGYIEPGGLSTRELLFFIQKLKNLKNIYMWDLVEVNPIKDINDLTSITAAKIIIEII
ncbi:MAG: arginase family protein [Candidatus Woesearchaeota archaeon]